MSAFCAARAIVAPRYFVLTLAACFTIVFDGPSLFPFEWTPTHLHHAACSVVIGLSNALLVFLCLANSRWSFVLGVPPLLLVCALAAYVQRFWGVELNSNVLGAVLEADSLETKTFLTWDMWLLLVCSATAGVVISVLYVKRCWYRQSWGLGFEHAFILCALAVALVFANQHINSSEIDFKDLFALTPAIFMGAVIFLIIKPGQLGAVGRAALWMGLIAIGLLALRYARKEEFLWMVMCAGALMGAWSICRVRGAPGEKACPHVGAAHTLGMAILLMPAFIEGVMPDTLLPAKLVNATSSYVEDLRYVANARKNRLDLATIPGAAADIPDKQLVVVLVVGESARADHFGLNGYARPTTPLLAAVPGLVSFTNVRSCAAATRIAVPCLLSRATESDPKRSSRETSLISLFRHFGFDTAWVSNNQLYGKHDTPVTAVASEARRQIFPILMQDPQRGTFDGELIPSFEQFLAGPSPRKLIVLHQRGSHWHYHERYPSAFGRFTPICKGDTSPSGCEIQNLINGYDNSILYTDHVLSAVIGLLVGKSALFLYTSDHGESLGEGGDFTHGSPERPEQRHVPMMWWASDLFRQQHPNVMPTLSAKRSQPVSHDNVFHSLLGCAGFHGSVIDESLNLCRP